MPGIFRAQEQERQCTQAGEGARRQCGTRGKELILAGAFHKSPDNFEIPSGLLSVHWIDLRKSLCNTK